MTTLETPSPAPRPARDLYSVSGQDFKQLTEAAITWLTTNKELVNALNVFPIPDGDTGTNMLMTMQAPYQKSNASIQADVSRLAPAMAHGALMGARGYRSYYRSTHDSSCFP